MNFSTTFLWTVAAMLFTAACAGVDEGVAAAGGAAEPVSAEASGERYAPSPDALAAVNEVLEAAGESGKLALVIMGANWCHDSRALASRLYQDPLAAVVRQNYETIFVDIGYLDKGRDVINSLGPPVYYATPTVLIVDPLTGQLVNAENRHQWANAEKISMADSVAYFRLMADSRGGPLNGPGATDPGLADALAGIESFESEAADRLWRAYAVIGPMLKAWELGRAPALFESYWNEVREFRSRVPRDVDALRKAAYEQAAAGAPGRALIYPEYPPFPWETAGK